MFELIARFFKWLKSWFSTVESETETVAEDVEDLAFTESEKLKESTEKFVDSVIASEAPVSEPEATPEAVETPVSESATLVIDPVEIPVIDPVDTKDEPTTESAT